MQAQQLKPVGKPRSLGPKQMAWCDEHLGNFGTYRKGVEQVIAETEASRKAVEQPAAGAHAEQKPADA